MAPSLLERLKTYLFPDGETAARAIPGIRTIQSGDIRSSEKSAWKSFSAEEIVDATRTTFWWDAKIGSGLASVGVTDAYEGGHGRLAVRKGPVPLVDMTGPHIDQGELQRYLSYVNYCPSMIVNNPFLDFAAVGLTTLRIRDRQDATGSFVDLDIADDGRPIVIRAVRPMTVGKRVIPTEWSAVGTNEHVWNGIRLCRHLEASWHPPDGRFVYVRIDVLSQSVIATTPISLAACP
ncbi:MAG TPA: DUF6544 family protein [Vicinamibacterales bacterium]|nr:DUF6544 family protein [Vicinamibacterales bacterium]